MLNQTITQMTVETQPNKISDYGIWKFDENFHKLTFQIASTIKCQVQEVDTKNDIVVENIVCIWQQLNFWISIYWKLFKCWVCTDRN